MLGLGAVPVVNENDTIATAEIRFGDNDRLAARVAQMISADMLVLLSDIDGLYTADPRNEPDARHLAAGRARSAPEIEAMAGEARTRLQLGRHGDQARRRAHRDERRLPHADRPQGDARRVHPPGPLAAIEDGARATLFLPSGEPRSARKAWIAGDASIRRARVIVDDGAARGVAPRQAACCRPASSRSRAISSAATR